MNLKEIEIRMGEISEMLKGEVTVEQVDELSQEVETLKEQRQALTEAVEKREALIQATLQGEGTIVEEIKEERKMENFDLKSPEYRSAYFKKLAGEQMNEMEARAYTHTTENFGGALPVQTLNEIWSNIAETHPIIGDITVYRTGSVLELSVHSAIAAGDAGEVDEAVAATDEENTFTKVTLSGKDFAKTVYVSYALGKIAAPALEAYLVREISDRLGAALAADVVAQIAADVHEDNVKTSAEVKETSYGELNGLFALLKQARGKVVYANASTIYNYLTSIVDSTGRPIFQPNAQADVAGFLLGAAVKEEDAVADNKFLIGAPSKVVGNFVQDILIESDRDIAKHQDIYSGYARFECKLTADKAFVVFSVKQA